MPEFPSMIGGNVVRDYGSVTATTDGTTVTASATVDTKGDWVELVSATTFDANWVIVQFPYNEWGGFPFLVDIGVGAAASEQVIIPDLQVYENEAPLVDHSYLFPVFIPAGVRLAARCQEPFESSAYLDVSVQLISGGFAAPGRPMLATAYGATSGSIGTSVDAGGTAHTKGAWTEIAAATVRDHHWLAIAASSIDGNWAANTRFFLDIGIGPATETVLIPNIALGGSTQSDNVVQSVFHYPVSVPAGARLSARLQSSSNNSGDRVLRVKIYGV